MHVALTLVSLLGYAAIALLALALSAQAAFTLYLMLFTWWRPERLERSGSPNAYLPPRLRFAALLPARHEEAVIADTIRRVWNADYPKELLEVVVICEGGDTGTIDQAERAVDGIGHPNVRVAVFHDGPINKPHGLNVGLQESTHEVITIFDAEDDVHPEIFQIANTVMQRDRASIVQAGVQLMDWRSSWFAVQNVLEYFFWFKSRLHYHAGVGMVPLGGNTMFIMRRLVEMVGGWDDRCLTEDADIGIRLSVLGERIAVTYDAAHVTREETPPTLGSFIKQRTRWHQGFLQVLRKGDWRLFPTRGQRLLAVYTLTHPFAQACVGVLWPISLLMIVAVKLPVWLAMISFLPLYGLAFQFLASVVGLIEFAGVYGLRLRPRDVAMLTLGFLPYQGLLTLGALRAVYRELSGIRNWEKTMHTGAHRTSDAATVDEGVKPVVA
jgi:glycosyltransferase XagB